MEEALKLANYLEQNASSYSNGIPLRSLREALDALPAESTPTDSLEKSVIVLTDDEDISRYQGDSGSLLQAVIEKGLKVSLEKVDCFYCTDNLCAELTDKLHDTTLVLLLGEGAQGWFAQHFANYSSQSFEIIDPREVIKDSSLKRTLWNQLKPIIELL